MDLISIGMNVIFVWIVHTFMICSKIQDSRHGFILGQAQEDVGACITEPPGSCFYTHGGLD